MTQDKSALFAFAFTFAFVGGGLAATSARAESLDDAQRNLSKAHHDFYDQLRKGGAGKTGEASRLSKDLLAPAQAKVGRALRREYAETLRRNRLDRSVATPDPVSPARVDRPHVASPSRSQSGLDGSKVPKVLEFGGKKKESPDGP